MTEDTDELVSLTKTAREGRRSRPDEGVKYGLDALKATAQKSRALWASRGVGAGRKGRRHETTDRGTAREG